MSKITQGKFKILSNKRVGPDCFKMAIGAPAIVRKAAPGQFVHLRCLNSTEPLLRRPFSLHRINRNNFEILYRAVGRGTNLLAKKRKGDKIDVLGPLGNGFQLSAFSYQLSAILVAGGIGVAPLLALAEKLIKAQRKKDILVLLGVKNKKQILCERDFKRLGARVQIASDDGTRGYKGLVTGLLRKVLRTNEPTNQRTNELTIYACGPKPMLKEIAQISFRLGMAAYASLEENMACGVGACLGCAIKTRESYKRVCKDGPVFNLKEIRW